MIGNLTKNSITGYSPIRESDLIRAFTDQEGAKKVTHREMEPRNRDESKEFLEAQISRWSVVPRSVEAELTELIYRDRRALIVVHGQGGSGKSILLAHWANGRNKRDWPKFGCFLTIKDASGLSPNLINQRLCDLGGFHVNHSRRMNDEKQAMCRLEIANPNAPRPVAVLCLDGIDEIARQADRNERLKEVLRLFWEEDKKARAVDDPPPPGTLIVTCRNVKQVHDLLSLDVSGFGISGSVPSELRVGNFSRDELVRAAQMDLAADTAGRFLATVRSDPRAQLGDLDDVFLTDRSPYAASPVRSHVFDLLRDPVIWRAFLQLGELTLQSLVLDGEASAIRSLAASFTEWFCRKAQEASRRRGRRRQGLFEDGRCEEPVARCSTFEGRGLD